MEVDVRMCDAGQGSRREWVLQRVPAETMQEELGVGCRMVEVLAEDLAAARPLPRGSVSAPIEFSSCSRTSNTSIQPYTGPFAVFYRVSTITKHPRSEWPSTTHLMIDWSHLVAAAGSMMAGVLEGRPLTQAAHAA